MREKINQQRWGFKERIIQRRCILIILLGLIISTPVTAATTQLHIVKYANDKITILNETTKTYQWLEANLPVVGDETTHYYSQGPTFNDFDLWDDAESLNIETRDWGAVKGTDLKDICNLIGGLTAGETVKIKASDGFSKTFPYEYIYSPNPRQGAMGITWYRADQGYTPGYNDSMRLVMFANAKTNTYGWNTSGWHVFGNADMRECWAPAYWYNYSGTYPSSGGVSVKWVSDIIIYSNQAPPVAPSAAFISDTQSGTAPLTVRFTDQSNGTTPLTYAWDFNNDGTIDSTIRNPSYTYTTAGTYSVNLTVTNVAGSDSELKTNYITANPAPIAPPVAVFTGTPVSGTAPLDVMFTDSSTGTSITNRRWDFGDNNISNYAVATNPSHRYSQAGTYSVNLTVTNGGGSNSRLRSNYISVGIPPSAPVAAFTGNPLTGTTPLDVIFTDSSTGTSIINRRWDFGDGNISNYAVATNPSHRYSSARMYTINLTVTNAGGSNSQLRSNYISVTATVVNARSKTGVYRPGVGFYLKMDNRSTWNPSSDMYQGWDNAAVDLPIAGDWNGDGRSETGVYRPGVGFYLKMDNSSTWNPSSDVYQDWDNTVVDLPIAGYFV
jgi:PKD repeat protein